MHAETWLPLTEFALRSGMSISTLRRKIKSNSISFKMEDGRYLIQSEELIDDPRETFSYSSSDARLTEPTNYAAPLEKQDAVANKASPNNLFDSSTTTSSTSTTPDRKREETVTESHTLLAAEVDRLKTELSDQALRSRALEARVSGLAKKLDLYSEHMAELKMLVRLFEEKLDNRA